METGLSEASQKRANRKLRSPFTKLDGQPLIRCRQTIKEDGSPGTSQVLITNVWRKNGEIFRGGGFTQSLGSDHTEPRVGSQRAPKEDPYKEDPYEERDDDEARARGNSKSEEPEERSLLKERLVGLVGLTAAQGFIMRAHRDGYDLGPVVEHVTKSLDKVRDPASLISAAIRDRADYSESLKKPQTSLSRAKRSKDDSNHRSCRDIALEDDYESFKEFFQLTGELELEVYLKRVFQDLIKFETPNEIKSKYKRDYILSWAQKLQHFEMRKI